VLELVWRRLKNLRQVDLLAYHEDISIFRQESMKDLSSRQQKEFKRSRIVPPEHYKAMETDERRAFVIGQIERGNHAKVESLSVSDLLTFFEETDRESPSNLLYRLVMEQRGAAEVEASLEDDLDFVLFFEIFGQERAQAVMSNSRLLQVYQSLASGDDEFITRAQVGAMLEQRGAEAVADEVYTDTDGKHFVQIFGLKSTGLLSKDIANRLKGKHLEEGIGL
jgi:hypothetical protein